VPTVVYRFAVPPNFVLQALRLREALNLFKLRNGLNIAGLELPVESLADANDAQVTLPAIGGGGQLVLPGSTVITPTPYRYATLIERARQLTQLAIQAEASMLAALEKLDAEEYNLLKARQDVRLAHAQVRLQDLRVREASDGVKLAELQQQRAQIQRDYFQSLLNGDLDRKSTRLNSSH